MIPLPNGHNLDFIAASGALAYKGEGWWFEKPWLLTRFLKPIELTFITKTLTYLPTVGNLKWWCPWCCVRQIPGGYVNAVGLTNPGYQWWIDQCYTHVCYKGYKCIVSIMPETLQEAREMCEDLNRLRSLVAVELNLSCPNVKHNETVSFMCDLVHEYVRNSRHPVILKLGCQHPYVEICKQLDRKIDAFDLINAVPWRMVFPHRNSPLARYGLVGSVSGPITKPFARRALSDVKTAGVQTPIISGSGVDGYYEVCHRMDGLGADAISFGVLFISKTYKPNQIIAQWRKEHA